MTTSKIIDHDVDGNEFSFEDCRVFFHPSAHFICWMKEHYGTRHIFDIGAGNGHCAKLLANAGLHVTAIDLAPREQPDFPVSESDSTTYPFDKDAVVMLCRPCHEHGFVRKTILRALNCGVRAIVYVGLNRNVRADLGGYYKRFTKRRIKDIGHADERIWELNVNRVQANANLRRGTIPPL